MKSGNSRRLSSIAGAVFCANSLMSPGALASEIIEKDEYAQNVANSLIENCPTTSDEVEKNEMLVSCLDATVNATYSIASDLSDFITEVKNPLQPLKAGQSSGDILSNCQAPAAAISGKDYSDLLAYKTAVVDFAKSCVPSIRRAAENVDLNWQPTAVNTIANFVNCMNGKQCITSNSGAITPVLIQN